MTLRVAIASEYDGYDGEIYRFLLEAILCTPVTKWTGAFVFNGCNSVAKSAPGFLLAAQRAGVRHALLAVDNDGGAMRRPEHEDQHVVPTFNIKDTTSCRACWLTAAVPAAWSGSGGLSCVVVPVQVIETWLLSIRGHSFSASTAERTYDRRALKRHFFGPGAFPPTRVAIAHAMTELQKPHALATLRTRPSFQRLEAALAAWLAPPASRPAAPAASPPAGP